MEDKKENNHVKIKLKFRSNSSKSKQIESQDEDASKFCKRKLNFIFQLNKKKYNQAKADGANNYLFTKTLNPLHYFNLNLELPQLQPIITTKLPLQDAFVESKIKSGY